jgi:hypothetical protein
VTGDDGGRASGSAPVPGPVTALTPLWLGALTVATRPLVEAAAGPGVPPVGLMAHVCGMLAGYGVLVLLVLVARAPAVERGIGADVLARWHARDGRAVVGARRA